MNKNFKKGAIIAASAASILSLAVATPSFAHSAKTFSSTSRTLSSDHIHASLPVTVTAVPSTVSVLRDAAAGAKFVAYTLATDATAIPATQPTTGGKYLKVSGTSLTAGVLTGTLKIDAGVANTTTKYAIYNAAGVGSFVVVTVDAAGVATAAAATPLTATYVAPISREKVEHIHATVAATITAVPTTITDAKLASRGAKFVAYKLAADAIAVPATQPTTGGKPVKVEGATLVAGVLTGTLKLDAGLAGTTTKYAIYNAAGAATFVTVTVDAAGVATAVAATPITAVYVAPTAPAYGEGKSVKGDRKHGGRR